ncbi:MAG TPA: type II toxin-antitoxin system HipA family toxin [Solirubrobacterales bacterium]|nr:type II toxin-antitoxin system HipA family toxin [Solirubrobacterales bacterium]
MSTLATVKLWDEPIGVVSVGEADRVASFEYEPEFAARELEVAPLTLPVEQRGPFRFPGLAPETFWGLPGLLADSLPDRYGMALTDIWLTSRGRAAGSLDPVERLCYVGRRGMGALEYEPALGPNPTRSHEIDVGALAELAGAILSKRDALRTELDKDGALEEILRIGSSAGGARAKALIALCPRSGEIRSGQLDVDPGFEHWLLKFDGVADSSREIGTPDGYGAIELAYSRMAVDAGIEMSECRLLEENGRRHFMTRRFDRLADGSKLHMQSLGAMAHLDFNLAGANSYEQALMTIRRLGLPMAAIEEQFRRMAFNVVARNQDDHVKNIAFLMDREGRWRLSPAFDVTYAFNPSGSWTGQHQMSLNSKREAFEREDFREVGRWASMKRGRAEQILAEVQDAARAWPEHASEAGVDEQRAEKIGHTLRLELPSG